MSQLAFENLSYKDSSDLDEIHLDFRRLNDSVTADIEDFKRNLQRKENALIDRRDKLFYQRQNLLQELEKERREK
ncbi:hypothetical protein N1495_07760 [Streptococcus didelphis]|uniref:Uncharacterized protein n=1 Tax=Streptococcus didelphis TaxID=102886 RepID=A0ABY9LIC5_9STRE|nr:hypothetical protein [Streptococcus didelphis]WMB28581.1 hypothetical protein N1496_03330 [Streptococcus didelphis]WMB29255.1 hypothetical protein N1495_07760 [Streptococcus didelphis]